MTLFLALSSDTGFLNRIYKYNCSNCGELNILREEEFEKFICYECRSPENLKNPDFLQDVKVLFEINNSLIRDVKQRLKAHSSSNKVKKNNRKLEEEPSLLEIFEINKVDEENSIVPAVSDIADKLNNMLTIGLEM